MPATAHSPGHQQPDDDRRKAIHGLNAQLLFQLQLASHWLVGRQPSRVIRFNMERVDELLDEIEALENGAPL